MQTIQTPCAAAPGPLSGATATAHVRRTAHVAATLTSPAGGPTLAEADALFIA